MRQKFPAVELFEAAIYFLPKPQIMIDVVFHELLHVVVGRRLDMSRSTIQLRLQFLTKVHFHELRVAGAVRGMVGDLYTG